MNEAHPFVIVGAGHGGVQLASSLRDEGYQGRVILVSDDPHLPYQRPTLSKSYMKGESSLDAISLRGLAWYEQKRIELMLGVHVRSLDRSSRAIVLDDGSRIDYAHCVLALGGKRRDISLPGRHFSGVVSLQSLTDAEDVRVRIEKAENIVVVGGGFIGLEFAAVASSLGRRVHVVELSERVMARAVSPVVSEFYAGFHRRNGVSLHLQTSLVAIQGKDNVVAGVELRSGEYIPADLVLFGVGAQANDDLARCAGLECNNGIVVDAMLATADEAVSAIGDCVSYPSYHAKRHVRLESVQNATDQARFLAKRLTGKGGAYTALSWFWSDQGSTKLQIAGLVEDCDRSVVRGDLQRGRFSVFAFRSGKLIAVESVNAPLDHMQARRLLANDIFIRPEEAADTSIELKSIGVA